MKKRGIILAVVFLIAAGTSFRQVNAQEKSKAEKEKEMQEAINEQKKAMAEQKRAQEELQKAMEEQKGAIDEAMKNYSLIWEDSNKFNRAFRIYEDMGRSRVYRPYEPFIVSPGVDVYLSHFNGDSESTTWNFTKNVKETTFSKDYTFDVESTVNTVVMAVNGDCREGDIRIKIIMPDGKTYSDIVIDEYGNLNWRKSFSVSETENQDKVGAWKFEINSNKATGYFKISLETY